MKRWIAVLAALCCLLLCVPTAGAEPAEPEDGVLTAPETEGSDQEALPEEETPEEPEEAPAPDPLAGTTAIRRLEAECVLDGSGKASVTQKIELSIVGSLETVRFAIPETAKKPQIAGYKAKGSTENGIRYLTVTAKDGFSGDQSFTLTYTQDGLVREAEGGQQLSVPLLSAQDYSIGTLVFSVTLPSAFDSYPDFSSGYYGPIIEDSLNYTASGGVVSGASGTVFQDHETLAMELLLPAGYFAGSFGESPAGTVLTVAILLLAVLTVLFWWRQLRSEPLRVQARTLPPDGVNPGDLPYLLSGGDADFNMLVSYWATLGYLSFYINKSGHVILRRRMGMGNERRAFERKLFDLLFGRENFCDGASLRYKKVGERAMAVIPRYWDRRLYSKDSGSPFLARLLCCLICAIATLLAMDVLAPDKLHGLFLLLAFVAGAALCWMVFLACGAYYLNDWIRTGIGVAAGLLLLVLGGLGGTTLTMLPAVALTAFIGWQTTHGGRRSDYGDEVIGQTLGFRRFLHNVSDHYMTQMLRRDPQYFYKILPYAEAMGQGKRFVALFHDVQLEPCQWYETAGIPPRTAAAFYDDYCETLAMLNVSIRK